MEKCSFGENSKKIFFFFFWGGGGWAAGVGSGGGGVGGQGGCEWRREAFVKIKKNIFLGGVRVDVNGDVKLL